MSDGPGHNPGQVVGPHAVLLRLGTRGLVVSLAGHRVVEDSSMNRALAPLVTLLVTVAHAAEVPDRHVVLISIDGLPASYLDDPRASLPVIRGLIGTGVVASGGMRVSDPSVTWPNHTTLMAGVHPDRHGVLVNGLLERRGPGELVRVVPGKDRRDPVRVPLLFVRLGEVELTSAAIDWPCTRGSGSIDDNFPDVPDQLRYTTPRLRDELEGAGLLRRFERGGARSATRSVPRRPAASSARKPRLLGLHLLNLDDTHHRHGPGSPAGYTSAALADANVGRVRRAGRGGPTGPDRRAPSLRPRVRPGHEDASAQRRAPPRGAADGRGRSNHLRASPRNRRGGHRAVFLTDPATAEQDRETVRRLFQGAEGIAAVLGPEDFTRYHLPRAGEQPGMADLVLAAREGYAVSGEATGAALVVPGTVTTGSHGYLSTEPRMNAVFVASGAGIEAGAKLDTVENTAVAPTVARLLDVSLDRASGRVLAEVLDGRE